MKNKYKRQINQNLGQKKVKKTVNYMWNGKVMINRLIAGQIKIYNFMK